MYYFNGFQEGTSAKCPPDMLGVDKLSVENDTNAVLGMINEFIK